MHPVAHLYPWDVIDDPDAPDRLRDAGIGAVNLAAAYHAVRAVTPFHPRRRFVEATRSARYAPARDARWPADGPRLEAPGGWAGESDFERAREALTVAGIEVRGWAVLTHRDTAGSDPDRGCVVNAFGERYGYALCPSWPHVRDYASTIAHVVAATGVATMEIEATGQLGVSHMSEHDKAGSAGFGPREEALLSLCFCGACDRQLRHRGIDPDRLADRVRLALRPGQAQPLDEVLGDAAPAVLDTRLSAADSLLSSVRQATGSGVTLWLHATPDEWATAPWRPVTGPLPVDGYVVPVWDGPQQGAVRIARLRHVVEADGRPARLAAYVNVIATAAPRTRDIRGVLDAAGDAGATEAHLYHVGLASPAQLATVANLFAHVQTGDLR